jgi:hypothetical protein
MMEEVELVKTGKRGFGWRGYYQKASEPRKKWPEHDAINSKQGYI